MALARALAHPPDMLLLDEPFSNLDAKLRDRSRQWLKTLQEQVGVTTVFVTHDQDEALSVSDRIAVMDQGRIRQIGTPAEVYDHPSDLFVADFVGTVNILPATVVDADGTHALIRLDGIGAPLRVPHTDKRIGPVRIAIRPENIDVVRHTAGDEPEGTLVASIESRAYLGDHYRYGIRIGATPVTVTTTRRIDADSLTFSLLRPRRSASSTKNHPRTRRTAMPPSTDAAEQVGILVPAKHARRRLSTRRPSNAA